MQIFRDAAADGEEMRIRDPSSIPRPHMSRVCTHFSAIYARQLETHKLRNKVLQTISTNCVFSLDFPTLSFHYPEIKGTEAALSK